MRFWIFWLALLLVSGLVNQACSPSAGPVSAPVTAPALQRTPGQTTGPGWEQRWEETLKAARQEGSVLVYTSQGNDMRMEVGGAFSQKFGIAVEWVTGGTSELVNKLVTERRAGLYLADALMGGTSTLVANFKPQGLLDPVEPVLILPEAKDMTVWKGGTPFYDKDTTAVSLLSIPTRHLARNTELVSENELKSYRDLLEPRWKGKITMYDPTMGGTTQSWTVGLVQKWGPEPAKDYLKKLAAQDLAMTREKRTQVEWVARGKYPLGLGLAQSEVADMVGKLKVPVAYVDVIEGVVLTTGGGGLGMVKKAAHPKAAIVFVNWLLTREGGLAIQKGHGNPSGRLDVPPTGLAPSLLVAPDTSKVSQMNEEYNAALELWVPVNREIFGPLLR